MSILTSFGVPIIIFTLHQISAETFTAAWLLPLVPPSTVAATGTSLCKLLIAQQRYSYAFVVLVTSYVILGVALCTACAIMVLYLNRLILHKLPPKEVIVSALLPVGAVGQGGYALLEAVSLFCNIKISSVALNSIRRVTGQSRVPIIPSSRTSTSSNR
jgi:tellurite resistance protein TehA-like permease